MGSPVTSSPYTETMPSIQSQPYIPTIGSWDYSPASIQQQTAMLTAGMAGLGFSTFQHPGAIPTSTHAHAPQQQYQTFQQPYSSSTPRHHARSYYSAHTPETSLDHSTGTIETVHSREASVETSATTAPSHAGSSLDLKSDEDSATEVSNFEDTNANANNDNSNTNDLAKSAPNSAQRALGRGDTNARSRSATTEGIVRNPGNRQSEKAGFDKVSLAMVQLLPRIH